MPGVGRRQGLIKRDGGKLVAAASYIALVSVSLLSELLPINGVATAAVFDSYGTLFSPDNLAFAIRWPILLLFAGFVYHRWAGFRAGTDAADSVMLKRTGALFSLSCVANVLWILAWHHYRILLSALLSAVMLLSLAAATEIARNRLRSGRERLFAGLPLGLYFGWVSVLTIANAAALLSQWGWRGTGPAEVLATALALVLGTALGAVVTLKRKDAAFGLAFAWAYLGILRKHLSPEGFGGRVPAVAAVAALCLLPLAAALLYAAAGSLRDRR